LAELSTGEATLANLKNTSLVFDISEPVFVFSNANNQYYTSGRLLFTAQRDFVNACGVDISGYVAFGEIEGGSGQAFANIRPQVTEDTDTSTTVTVSGTNQDTIDKLAGQVKKRGNILTPSDEELDIAREANRRRIQKYIPK
jgi:hypothetical protein